MTSSFPNLRVTLNKELAFHYVNRCAAVCGNRLGKRE